MWEQKKENQQEYVTVCGKYSKSTVKIDYYVMAKIKHLMEKYNNLEWLAYLIGNDAAVDDIYIPEQKVTSGAVTDIKADPTIAIVGVVHSHHNLGLHNFSGTDHAYINDNHDLSILVWNEKNGAIGINGQKKITLPCGAKMVVPIELEFFHPDLNTAEWDAEANENISENKYVMPAAGVYPINPARPIYPVPSIAPTSGVNGRFYDPEVWSSKKKIKETIPGNPSSRRNDDYEKYLDHLVYDLDDDMEMVEEHTEDYLCQEDVEAHFERIEARECGLTPKKKITNVTEWI